MTSLYSVVDTAVLNESLSSTGFAFI